MLGEMTYHGFGGGVCGFVGLKMIGFQGRAFSELCDDGGLWSRRTARRGVGMDHLVIGLLTKR